MTGLYSLEDKKRAIRKFIFAKSKKLAKIINYNPIRECLEEERINPLFNIKKSGKKYASSWDTNPSLYYTVDDAQTYFQWLISVVTESVEVSEGTIKKAINQLFIFLFILDGTLDVHQQTALLTPYSLDEELEKLCNRISNFENKLKRMDVEIIDVLNKIMKWQQKYQSYLDRMKREQDSFDNALKSNGDDK